MSITSQPIRRSLTIVLAIAALLVGFGAIRAASAWTASTAPLVASPASAKTVEAQLIAEQARSAALEEQLLSLTAQTDEMTSALEAAQARIATDATHADDLAAQLAAAKARLKALEKAIRVAAANAAANAARAAAATTAPTTSSSSGHAGDDDGPGEPDDD